MSNPTGTIYLTANSGYLWTDGDVYEIAQTDAQEGAAAGASFSGLGVDNQPHQLLLNKIQFTHGKQVVDEENIASLQAFAAAFAGTVGPNGFIRIGCQDTVRGLIAVTVQWGQYSIGSDLTSDTPYAIAWPTAFSNACLWAGATAANPASNSGYGQAQIEVVSFSRNSGIFFVDYIGGTAGNKNMPGFYWLAIGY
ncbi:MAG TPA: hypothetical protein VJN94_17135 [Candidatus Binataceae bacterium]|nr:hypothetical protein [Candidatus Binataceae bacterium]